MITRCNWILSQYGKEASDEEEVMDISSDNDDNVEVKKWNSDNNELKHIMSPFTKG